MKYRDLLAEWWEGYRGELVDTTRHKKEGEMQVHILPALGDNDVQDTTREVLQKYVEDKQKHGSPIRHPQGLKPATIICHFHIIKPSLDLAVEKGMIAKNPCSEVNLPKIEDREVSVFKNQDAKRLISFARPKWFGDIILLAYHTGMRRVFGG